MRKQHSPIFTNQDGRSRRLVVGKILENRFEFVFRGSLLCITSPSACERKQKRQGYGCYSNAECHAQFLAAGKRKHATWSESIVMVRSVREIIQ